MKRHFRASRSGSYPPRQARPNREGLEPVDMTVTFEAMGARGEASAPGPQGPIYTPFALPGEHADIRVVGAKARLTTLHAASPDRVAAPCPHFTRCGGCQIQHWREEALLAWKRERVREALAKRGLEAEVDPTRTAWGAGRRRIGVHVQREGGAVAFGFVAQGGGAVAEVGPCPAMTAGLEAALERLKAFAAVIAPARGEAVLQTLETSAGLDVDVRGAGRISDLDRTALLRWTEAAEAADLARVALFGETLVGRRPCSLTFGPAEVRPPPGAFTQPTQAGEAALVGLAAAGMAGAERIADLFCGIGTFALPLAERAPVWAVDGDGAMIAALQAGADAAAGRGLIRPVETVRRDLLRQPVAALELKRCDGVVFDPPRSGARLQAEQIAAAGSVTRVAAVSCDPATLARDLRILVDGGFTLGAVTPVDQFRWTPHVEVVAVLTR